MSSYLTSIDTFSLSRTFFEIFDFEVFRVWPWPLTSKGHLGSNFLYNLKAHIWLPICLPWTTYLYLVSFSKYLTSKFLGFDLDLWPLKVIWGQNFVYHLKSRIWLPIWLLRDNAGQGQGHFFYPRKGTFSHQTASFEILRMKIGSAVLAVRVPKSVKSFFKKKRKKSQTLICWVYVPQSLKILPKPNFAGLFRSMT